MDKDERVRELRLKIIEQRRYIRDLEAYVEDPPWVYDDREEQAEQRQIVQAFIAVRASCPNCGTGGRSEPDSMTVCAFCRPARDMLDKLRK